MKIYYVNSNYKTPEQYRKFAKYNSKTNKTYIICTYDARNSLQSCFSKPSKEQALKSAKVFGGKNGYVTVTSYKK